MDKTYVTMEEVYGHVHEILRQMHKNQWRPDYIVGIARGGLIPAVLLSQYLDVPMYTLRISLRDHYDKSESNLWMADDAYGYIPESERGDDPTRTSDPARRRQILVVDDINDSGATLNWLMRDWPASCLPDDHNSWDEIWGRDVRFAVLYDNLASQCDIGMNYVGTEIDKSEKDQWIVFPWENWWHQS